jgi:hypothetical protein
MPSWRVACSDAVIPRYRPCVGRAGLDPSRTVLACIGNTSGNPPIGSGARGDRTVGSALVGKATGTQIPTKVYVAQKGKVGQ